MKKVNHVECICHVCKKEFCTDDNDKKCLMLKKDVYPYEYMDSWERFDEISLSK